jgi:hypothetical protein
MNNIFGIKKNEYGGGTLTPVEGGSGAGGGIVEIYVSGASEYMYKNYECTETYSALELFPMNEPDTILSRNYKIIDVSKGYPSLRNMLLLEPDLSNGCMVLYISGVNDNDEVSSSKYYTSEYQSK